MELIEHSFACPYCWQPISIQIDPSEDHQTYIEDCQVCCQPIEFRVVAHDGELDSVDILRAQ